MCAHYMHALTNVLHEPGVQISDIVSYMISLGLWPVKEMADYTDVSALNPPVFDYRFL